MEYIKTKKQLDLLHKDTEKIWIYSTYSGDVDFIK